MYASAAAVVVAGGAWWFAAAPDTRTDPRMAAWQTTVEEALPDRVDQVDAGTFALDVGSVVDRHASVSPGMHVVDVVCAGHGQIRLRLGTGADGGRTVPCAERPAPVTFTVGLATEFYLLVDAETNGAVVVRWRLTALPT